MVYLLVVQSKVGKSEALEVHHHSLPFPLTTLETSIDLIHP